MHFMPSTLSKTPVDLCVGPQPSPQKYPSLQRWNPPPGFLWSHAATERGPKWGTALGYAVLLQALEEAARSRRYGGRFFCGFWGLRFHGRIWGVEGSGRIQIIVLIPWYFDAFEAWKVEESKMCWSLSTNRIWVFTVQRADQATCVYSSNALRLWRPSTAHQFQGLFLLPSSIENSFGRSHCLPCRDDHPINVVD